MSNHYKTNIEHQSNLYHLEEKLGQTLKFVISVREKGEFTPYDINRLYLMLYDSYDWYRKFRNTKIEEENAVSEK